MKLQCETKDRGLSLIELLVAVVVLAIAMSGIVWMINLASRYYSSSSKEVELQDEVQKTFSIVSGYVSGAVSVQKDMPSTGAYVIEQPRRKYLVAVNGTGLYVSQYDATATIDSTKYGACIGDTNNMLVSHVQTFTIDTSTVSKGYVKVSLQIAYGARSANIAKYVYLRNSASSQQYEEMDITKDASGWKFSVKKRTNGDILKDANVYVTFYLDAQLTSVSSFAFDSGCDVSMVSVESFDPSTGMAVFKVKLGKKWEKDKSITITLQPPSGVTLGNKTALIGISR